MQYHKYNNERGRGSCSLVIQRFFQAKRKDVNMKKLVALLIAACMVFALCACGQTNQPVSTEPSETLPVTEDTQPSEEATEPTADAE